jgi:hypothetical protein
MADATIDYTSHTGRVVFPRSPLELTNTSICPACLTPLISSICSSCGLDLNHPAAADLFQASTDVAEALERRLALIGRIRHETEQLHQQQAAARAAVLIEQTSTVPVSDSIPLSPVPALAQAPAAAASTSDALRRTTRRSSVQVVMLIVGVSLLSMAAIFFLVFAFINYGLLARSLIIGGITVAAVIIASVLRRKDLRVTAEGIAVFAAILIYLDAFAVRANDLAGLGSSDGAVYWGSTLLASAGVFMLWHRASGLRVPSIVGFATFAPGLGLLAGGLAIGLATPGRYFVGFVAAALAGLAHPLARTPDSKVRAEQKGRVEATTLLVSGLFALVCGFFTAFAVQPDNAWGACIGLLIVALVALLYVVGAAAANAQHAAVRAGTAIAASIGALAVASTGAAVAVRTGSFEAMLFWPLLIATLAVLTLETMMRKATKFTYAFAARSATVSAAVIFSVTLLVTVATSLTTLAVAARGYGNPWSISVGTVPVPLGPPVKIALAALATATVLALAFWAATGVLRRRVTTLVWTGCTFVVLAVPLLETLWVIAVVWFLIAALGLALLVAPAPQVASARGLPLRTSYRLPLACGGGAALALGYSVSWFSVDIWGWATLVSIALLLGARTAVDVSSPLPRALLLSAATLAGLIGAAALAHQWDGSMTSSTPSIDAVRFVGILATALLALAALVPERGGSSTMPGVSPLDRRITFWITAPTALTAAGAGMVMLARLGAGHEPAGILLPEYWTSLILAIALLGALVLWAAGTRASARRAERAFTVLAITPVSYWIVDSFVRAAHLPMGAVATAPVVAALLVSAGSLALTARRMPSAPRWFSDVSVALVAVPGVLIALVTARDTAWLVLVVAGVTALILAASHDGLFASTSPRKQLGWLALVLATSGLWMRLDGERVAALEAYVLPVAAVLLLVSAAIARSARGRETSSHTAPFIALGGLLVAILPLAADASTGAAVRAYIVGALCSVLLLVASYVRGRAMLRPYLDVAILAGTLGVLTTTAGRAIWLVGTPGGSSDFTLELWLGGAFIVLITAAIGVTHRSGNPERYYHSAGSILVVLGMTLVFVFEAVSFDPSGQGFARAFVTLILFLAVYLAGALLQRAPFTRAVGWIALGFGAATALIGIVTSAIDPIEFGTVPVALAMLADGVVRLAENERVRSWPALGPGIIVLLAPSLLTTIDERPLWRLVALGIAAVAVLAIGAVRRLQAPFVLGVIVALVHGTATFSAEIRVVYETLPGWLWLGIGGVLLIAIAARYEQRIKNFKDVTRMVTSLR